MLSNIQFHENVYRRSRFIHPRSFGMPTACRIIQLQWMN